MASTTVAGVCRDTTKCRIEDFNTSIAGTDATSPLESRIGGVDGDAPFLFANIWSNSVKGQLAHSRMIVGFPLHNSAVSVLTVSPNS
jgi:hypothetical protein